MFRMWAKIFKDNHLLKDTVICNEKEDTRTHLTWENRSGWTLQLRNLSAMPRPGLHRIILLSRLILIILKFM